LAAPDEVDEDVVVIPDSGGRAAPTVSFCELHQLRCAFVPVLAHRNLSAGCRIGQ